MLYEMQKQRIAAHPRMLVSALLFDAAIGLVQFSLYASLSRLLLAQAGVRLYLDETKKTGLGTLLN